MNSLAFFISWVYFIIYKHIFVSTKKPLCWLGDYNLMHKSILQCIIHASKCNKITNRLITMMSIEVLKFISLFFKILIKKQNFYFYFFLDK